MLSRAQGVEVGGEDCPWHLAHAGGQTLRRRWLGLVTGLGSSLLPWALGRVGAVCSAGGAVGLGVPGHTPSLCSSFPLSGGRGSPAQPGHPLLDPRLQNRHCLVWVSSGHSDAA